MLSDVTDRTEDGSADPGPLFRALRDAAEHERSGRLQLVSARELRQLRFLEGAIADASSDVPGERLGDVLVRHGLLSQADLDGAVEVVLRERKRLGPVLAEKGLLDEARIREAIGLHVREIVSAALGRAGLKVAFEELPEDEVETDFECPLSPAQLILDASRRVGLEHVTRAIAADGRVLVVTKDERARARGVTLTPADGFILSQVDGTLRAADLAGVIPLPREEFERSLFGLISIGLVGFMEPRAPAPPRARREPAPASDAVPPAPPPPAGSSRADGPDYAAGAAADRSVSRRADGPGFDDTPGGIPRARASRAEELAGAAPVHPRGAPRPRAHALRGARHRPGRERGRRARCLRAPHADVPPRRAARAGAGRRRGAARGRVPARGRSVRGAEERRGARRVRQQPEAVAAQGAGSSASAARTCFGPAACSRAARGFAVAFAGECTRRAGRTGRCWGCCRTCGRIGHDRGTGLPCRTDRRPRRSGGLARGRAHGRGARGGRRRSPDRGDRRCRDAHRGRRVLGRDPEARAAASAARVVRAGRARVWRWPRPTPGTRSGGAARRRRSALRSRTARATRSRACGSRASTSSSACPRARPRSAVRCSRSTRSTPRRARRSATATRRRPASAIKKLLNRR